MSQRNSIDSDCNHNSFEWMHAVSSENGPVRENAMTMKGKSIANYKLMLNSMMVLLLWLLMAGSVFAVEQVVYYHTDALGSVVATTDESGDVLWRESYKPFGDRIDNTVSSKDNTPFYTGKPHDDETGLSYFGARYYDPLIGRFTGIDPVEVDPENLHSFNRYAYANNNPYRYVDPDGRLPIVPIAIFLAKELAGEVFEQATGLPAPTVKGVGKRLLKKGGSAAFTSTTKRGTEIVQRAMSQAELSNIRKTGVLSRTKPDGTVLDGDHFVSNAVNSNANRARERLALPGTPEVRVTLEVPKGVFSTPSKVQSRFNMPGGGLERTAPGNLDIPATIRRVD